MQNPALTELPHRPLMNFLTAWSAAGYGGATPRAGSRQRWLEPPRPDRGGLPRPLTLMWTVTGPVSCVSSWYAMNAADTYETIHPESGIRYQPAGLVGPIDRPPDGLLTYMCEL